MKQNDFYEVDGCTDFIPVKLIKEYKHLNLLEVESTESGYRGVVPHMYSFPKVNEPQKPVIPKFVADFYESIKDDFEDKVYDLCLQFNRDNGELSSEVWEWFGCGKNEPIQTLVKMQLFGYEVEQEKLYTAKLKSTGEYLHYDTHTCKVHHLFHYDNMAKKSRLYHFNEDELRKYNAWENDVYDVNEVR